MTKEVAKVLKERLAVDGGLSFVDVLAGLAQTVSYKTVDANDNAITKRMPVTTDHNMEPGCDITQERQLIPDSSKKGILYFEDLGSSFVDRVSGGAMKYRATLVLVCWMNRANFAGNNYVEITGACVGTILKKLKPLRITNEGMLTRFKVTPGRILPQNAAIFSRYTYEEEVTQYLRPPFEFFGMELTVEYAVQPHCLTEIPQGEPICY